MARVKEMGSGDAMMKAGSASRIATPRNAGRLGRQRIRRVMHLNFTIVDTREVEEANNWRACVVARARHGRLRGGEVTRARCCVKRRSAYILHVIN